MVANIPPLLLDWWRDLPSGDPNHVKRVLGNLSSLLDLQPNKMLIEAATLFWVNERVVFRFGDIEMTPLLEEIGGFAMLPWDSSDLLAPENCTSRGFLKMMELNKNDDLECLKNS